MTSSTPLRDSAFISYSHKDRALLEQFQAHLKPLIRDHNLRVWDDTNIKPGDTWKAEIERALASARVAVLLISRSFLASDFIAGEELPRLLKAAKDEGARILPVILSPSVFSLTPLSQFQTVNDPARPLSAMTEHQQEEVWASLAIEVYQALTAPYPIGTRLLTYIGHTNRINTVAWSPDGKRIASGSGRFPSPRAHYDYSVQIWEATTGQRLLTYQGHTNRARQAAWSPDGRRVASASADKTVQVWEATTGNQLLVYTGHTGAIWSIAWSPDGRRITSASGDKTIHTWEAATGQRLAIYAGHSEDINTLDWSSDGKRIASAGDDKTVQLWDAATAQHLLTYTGHSDAVYSVAWSPDDKRVASASEDKTVQLWDAATARHLLTYTGHKGRIWSVAWSPDGMCVASASVDQTVKIWDAATGQHLYTYTGHSARVSSVAWSPDGTRIASAGWDETVQVWSAG